jgi:hypothetical protein
VKQAQQALHLRQQQSPGQQHHRDAAGHRRSPNHRALRMLLALSAAMFAALVCAAVSSFQHLNNNNASLTTSLWWTSESEADTWIEADLGWTEYGEFEGVDQKELTVLVDAQLERATALETELVTASRADTEDGRALIEAAYQAAVRIDPTEPRPYYPLGHVLRARGPSASEDSLAMLNVAWLLDPDHAGITSSLAYALIATPGHDEVATAQRRHGLGLLSSGVRRGLWPSSDAIWQHSMELLPWVSSPPAFVVQNRSDYLCLLLHLEQQHLADLVAAEAQALLPHYAVHREGLARPYGRLRQYDLWQRCGLRSTQGGVGRNATGLRASQQQAHTVYGQKDLDLTGLEATCAALREAAKVAPGANIHSASFLAIAPGTAIAPHCGPHNGRLVVHVPLRVPTSSDNSVRLRFGRPSHLNETAAELRALGLPGQEAEEMAWNPGEGFVWDDSTCHEIIWHTNPQASMQSDRPAAAALVQQQGEDQDGEEGEIARAPEEEEEEEEDEAVAAEPGEEFAAREPAIALVVMIFHPALTHQPVCV